MLRDIVGKWRRAGRLQAGDVGIPPLVQGLMPAGIHRASWREFKTSFGTTVLRENRIRQLESIGHFLGRAGCRAIYVGGSLISAKLKPLDFDACWVKDGVNLELVRSRAPELLETFAIRAARFKGDIWISDELVTASDKSEMPALEYLQRNPRRKARVGVLLLDPGELT
jgi:hypothetical protein